MYTATRASMFLLKHVRTICMSELKSNKLAHRWIVKKRETEGGWLRILLNQSRKWKRNNYFDTVWKCFLYTRSIYTHLHARTHMTHVHSFHIFFLRSLTFETRMYLPFVGFSKHRFMPSNSLWNYSNDSWNQVGVVVKSLCIKCNMEHWKLRKPQTHTSAFVQTPTQTTRITVPRTHTNTWSSIEWEKDGWANNIA